MVSHISGYDPETGICWHFNNKGDTARPRCKCPAHSVGYDKRVLALFGRCRSGSRWFWVAHTYGKKKEASGWADTEAEAMVEAMAAVHGFRDGQPILAFLRQDCASDKLKELNAAKRAARPAPDATDARITEYLFASDRVDFDGMSPSEWVIYAFPIVKKTAKRIYYKRKKLRWLPEIDAPDISDSSILDMTFGDADIGYVDRQKLEARGEVYNHGRHWSAQDFYLLLKPPLLHDPEPELPDIVELKRAMADAHPDHGGSGAAFIAARKKYLEARQAQQRAAGGA